MVSVATGTSQRRPRFVLPSSGQSSGGQFRSRSRPRNHPDGSEGASSDGSRCGLVRRGSPAHLNDRPFDMWRSQIVRKGDTLFLKHQKRLQSLSCCRGRDQPCAGPREQINQPCIHVRWLRGRSLRKGDLLFSGAPEHHLRSAGKVFKPRADRPTKGIGLSERS